MSDVPSALTREEWAKVNAGEYDAYDMLVRWEDADLPTIVALANHDIPATDPRKITRADVEALKEIARNGDWPGVTDVQRVAAKLNALLPP